MGTIKSYGTIYMVHRQNLREVLYATLDTIQHSLGALDSKLPCALECMLPSTLDSMLSSAVD